MKSNIAHILHRFASVLKPDINTTQMQIKAYIFFAMLLCCFILVTNKQLSAENINETIYNNDTPLFSKLDIKCKKTLSREMMSELEGGGSTIDMIESQQVWMSCQDKLMNRIFRDVKKEVKRFSQYDDSNEYNRKELRSMPGKLDESQKAWSDAMRLTCQVEADQYVGGTLSGIIYGNCKAEMTTSRILDLKRLCEAFCDR